MSVRGGASAELCPPIFAAAPRFAARGAKKDERTRAVPYIAARFLQLKSRVKQVNNSQTEMTPNSIFKK